MAIQNDTMLRPHIGHIDGGYNNNNVLTDNPAEDLGDVMSILQDAQAEQRALKGLFR